MTHEFRIVTPFESIKEVYYRMYQSGQYIMPVMNGEDLIGVVDMNTLQDFIEKEV
jgi:predicted transcriptional regulator